MDAEMITIHPTRVGVHLYAIPVHEVVDFDQVIRGRI